MSNLFKGVPDRRTLVYQAVGAASMAWENVRGAGVFDEAWACRVASDLLERLKELDEQE